MKKQSKRNLLLQSVLASTFFVAPMVAQADQITTPVAGTISTSGTANNIIEITPNGQVTGAGVDAVHIDTNKGTVIIDPANQHPSAGVFGAGAIEASGNGIDVQATNGIIIIGEQSGVTVTGTENPIRFSLSGGTLTNAGTIQTSGAGATGNVVDIFPGGSDTTINNLLGGIIQNAVDAPTAVATIFTNALSSGFSLTNNGLITQSRLNADAIRLTGAFDSIVNEAHGEIMHLVPVTIAKGHALSILDIGGGDITNAGFIISKGGGDALFVKNSTANDMNIGVINNSGTIANTGFDQPVPPPFIPAGSALGIIVSSTGDVVISEIINTNTGIFSSIQPETFATIYTQSGKGVTGNIIITNGLVNNGDITVDVANAIRAIDFSDNATQATLFQQGGTIAGDVFLAPLASPNAPSGNTVLVMTGGTIAGNVYGIPTNKNTFNVSGGHLAGRLEFTNKGETLNLSGGFINVIDGFATVGNTDTINITGGDFDVLNTSALGTSFTNININSSFVQNGTIFDFVGLIEGGGSLLNITVNGIGTIYTLNGDIMGLNDRLVVNEGATFIPNGRINFTGGVGTGLKNNGTVLIIDSPLFNMLSGATFITDPAQVILAAGGVLTINGDATPNVFDLQKGSSLVEQIVGFCPPGGVADAGLLVVNSTFNGTVVNLELGSFLVPQVSGIVADGATFDVIRVNDGFANAATPFHLINNDAQLVQPASATLSFTVEEEIVTGISETLQLVAHRNAFGGFVGGAAAGVAGAFDDIIANGICNNDLCTAIGILDFSTTEEINAAFDSLTPAHNYGLIAATHIGIDSMFEGITDRVWDVAWHHRDHGRRHSGRPLRAKVGGVSSGDLYNHAGIWLRPIVAYVDQSSDDDVAGYKAKAWGGAIGFDWGVTDCTTLGAAISYTHVNVDDKAFAPKDEQVEAWMGTLYGSFDFTHGIFFDAMIAGAHNDYDVNRVIAVNSLLTAADSSFDGTTWAAQADLGMALPNVNFFLAPFARLKWVHVNFDDFTETGAGGLDLAVSTDDATEFLGGIGIRMAGDVVYGDVDWVPELMAMIGYDFTLDGEDTLANFVDCGPSFATDGIVPGRTVFDLGLALNAMIGPCAVVTAKYNLELREDFVSNAAYVQYFYNWS